MCLEYLEMQLINASFILCVYSGPVLLIIFYTDDVRYYIMTCLSTYSVLTEIALCLSVPFSDMEELRKSNQELLQKLKIGQAKAWTILNDSSIQNQKKAVSKSMVNEFQPPFTFSTPTKTYIDFLDKASHERYARIAPRDHSCSTNHDDQSITPLSDIMNVSSSSTYGRPHKLSIKEKTLGSSPIHSPHCTENHRERLHQKLNASYSKLAADLRQIAPSYGADLAYDLSVSSGISNKPDSYYDDLKKFRMANSGLCSVKLPDHLNTSQDTIEVEDKENSNQVEETNHQCIQTYSISKGYRAVDSHSGGQCPLCIGADDTKHKGLIRVNIPNEELVNYKVYPRETDDSVSLSSHCAMGWEHTSTQYKSLKRN